MLRKIYQQKEYLIPRIHQKFIKTIGREKPESIQKTKGSARQSEKKKKKKKKRLVEDLQKAVIQFFSR